MKFQTIKHFSYFLIILYLNVFNSCSKNKQGKLDIVAKANDSVSYYLKKSKNNLYSEENRKNSLKKSFKINYSNNNDSLKIKNSLRIAFQAYNLNDSILFRQMSNESLHLAIKLKDSLSLAQFHWNEGLFYYKNEKLDIAYSHYLDAYKYYESLNNKFLSARMLYNMSIIQNDVKDYTGSEILTFQAIKKFDKNKHPLYLYRCYNNLGTVYSNLKEFDKGIEYYELALEYLDAVENKKTREESVFNNLGLLYTNKRDFKTANIYFLKALKNDSLKKINISLYAKLIDNLAHNKILNGETLNVKKDLFEAKKIRDSINYLSGIIISNLHISNYYLLKSDTINAINYAKESLRLAKKVDNNRDYLAALKLLSQIDTVNTNKYLRTYLKINDSLHDDERKLRNKFTRIRFETNNYIKEADRQALNKIIVLFTSTLIIIILLLLQYLRRQKSKNKELVLEAEQQKANKDIYNLLLKQQAKLEEGRLIERRRISQDLHDGVLGKLFATRMRLDFLEIEGTKDIQDNYQKYLEELQGAEEEIRVISHALNSQVFEEDFNFKLIIEHLLNEQSSILNYIIIVKENINWDLITDIIKINCYRVIQEATQNINKHSKAKNIRISFLLINNTLKLQIEDDGVGFDIKKCKKGIGIQNMTNRIKKLKGSIEIISKIKTGTTLKINIPI